MRELSTEDKKAQKTLERIQKMKNAVMQPLWKTHEEETFEVQIKIDNKVSHGKFVPSKAIEGIWYTSEQTYRAMKKNIFALGDDVDELVSPYTCLSCKTNLDQQFWHFCPYCGEQFKESL